MHDIETAADIDRLVEHFYQRALRDELIGFFFTDIARIDLPKHLPKISRFWQNQLLESFPDYRARTFEAHLDIHQRAAFQPAHFNRWLGLWQASVDALFSGPRAEQAKTRGRAIATSLHQGLNLRAPEAGSSPAEAGRVGQYIPPGGD